MRSSLVFLVLLIALSGCTDRDKATAAVTRRDSADVTIAHLAALNTDALPAWSSTPLYSTTTHDTLQLAGTVTAVFAPDSSLAIGSASDLLSLSPDGHTLRRLGRQGSGPGEYRGILRVGIAEDSTLFVADYSGRITHLTADGRVLGIIPRLEAGSSRRELDVLGWLGSGRVVATWWQQRPNRGDIVGLPSGNVERDPVPLLVYDSTGQLIDSLGLWRGLERALVPPGSRFPIPFARSVVYDARGSTIAIGPTDSLDVSLFQGTQLTLRLTGSGHQTAPTEADVSAWRQGISDDFGEMASVILEAMQDAPKLDRLPAVGALVVDDQRNIWVGEYVTPGTKERRWTVISPTGVPVATMVLPAAPEAFMPGRSEILDAYGDRLALLRMSEDGELSIEVRRFSAALD
ncbi:MAG: hypothetical protein R2910_13215 [Gemmatimonadales bacterium]